MEVLAFEKPLLEIENKRSQLRQLILQQAAAQVKAVKAAQNSKAQTELAQLDHQFKILAEGIYSSLSAYEITQMSRHPNRPLALDIINQLCSTFMELHGDRNFMDDPSIVGGLAKFRGIRAVFLGHQKGRGTKDNVYRNFGMPRPEGFRKALRLMSLAERMNLPIVTFIDTPGAYPGMDAEERGQSEAIAKNIMVMSKLKVPIVSIVVGEGGSGGALALALGNRVLMLQYATYSVISPEGCASILWKDGAQAARAAQALGVTAQKAQQLGLIDGIVKEPLGGAHWDIHTCIQSVGDHIETHLKELMSWTPDQLREHRMQKYLHMGETVQKPVISPFCRESALNLDWEISWHGN